jgi:uncharacterized protein (TIGR02265 family)
MRGVAWILRALDSGDLTVDASVLESVARLHEPSGAFKDELRAVGFDVDRPEMRYSPEVLLAVLDVCAKHRYPELSRDDAHRQIGRKFVAHFFGTFLGRVAGTLVHALGVKRFLLQVPKVAAMVTKGLKIQSEQVSPDEIRIVFRGDKNMSADYTTGAIEGAASAGKFQIKAEIVRREKAEFEVRITGIR